MRIWSDGDDVQCSCFLPAPPIRVPSRAATTNMCPFKICGNGSESRLPSRAGLTIRYCQLLFQKDTGGNGLRCHRGVVVLHPTKTKLVYCLRASVRANHDRG